MLRAKEAHSVLVSGLLFEDSDALPYDTSAGVVAVFPNTTKVQVPETNKQTEDNNLK